MIPLVRQLGSTGLTVSRIGLGLAALGRPGYINLGRDVDLGSTRSEGELEQRCHEMLDRAYAEGIRYVDAARSYGLAESFLASWLTARKLPPGAITVGSKWGYRYTADWRIDAPVHEVKDLSLATLQRQMTESRQWLGQHLQLYQVHSATLESGVLDDELVLRELARLRSEGLAIGLTVSGPKQAEVIRRALAVRVDGMNPFQVVQATWNLLEVSAGSALEEAKARGWAVIVKEAVANGRLADRGSGEESAPVKRYAASIGATLDAIAVGAALRQPWSDVVLSGAVTGLQLRSNLAALDLIPAADNLPSIAVPPAEYWATRSSLGWG